jgi:hypothetical protein
MRPPRDVPAPAGRRWIAFIPATSGPRNVDEHFGKSDAERANAAAALETLTGKALGDDFVAWRNVVMQVTDLAVDAGSPMPTNIVSTYYQPENLSIGTAILQQSHSCFAAGTPVVAKRGVLPIDQVCIGELVLSRNIETGETAYKPVLARSLRPRVPMTKLSVGNESLLATPGHPFMTEEGWAKVRNLKANGRLFAEAGSLTLSKSEPAEPAQAYNLIVADFGTYFVGKSHLLVHDNSPVRDAPVKRDAKPSSIKGSGVTQ